jgi:hypothetical protein
MRGWLLVLCCVCGWYGVNGDTSFCTGALSVGV